MKIIGDMLINTFVGFVVLSSIGLLVAGMIYFTQGREYLLFYPIVLLVCLIVGTLIKRLLEHCGR